MSDFSEGMKLRMATLVAASVGVPVTAVSVVVEAVVSSRRRLFLNLQPMQQAAQAAAQQAQAEAEAHREHLTSQAQAAPPASTQPDAQQVDRAGVGVGAPDGDLDAVQEDAGLQLLRDGGASLRVPWRSSPCATSYPAFS